MSEPGQNGHSGWVEVAGRPGWFEYFYEAKSTGTFAWRPQVDLEVAGVSFVPSKGHCPCVKMVYKYPILDPCKTLQEALDVAVSAAKDFYCAKVESLGFEAIERKELEALRAERDELAKRIEGLEAERAEMCEVRKEGR